MTIEEQIMKLQTYKMYEDEDTVYVERDDIMKLLEQQPCEDMEVIQVSKGALKSRQGRFVIYDVEWLKKNFYLEENLYGQPKQPKRGKWLNNPDAFICSECGAELYDVWKYCPECGSDNREEADE